MIFDNTLYARDEEMDEFGDSGAYGDSLEEDYEEEEEEEEAELPGMIEPQPSPRLLLQLRRDLRVVEALPNRRVNRRRKNQPRKSRPQKSCGRSRRRRRNQRASRPRRKSRKRSRRGRHRRKKPLARASVARFDHVRVAPSAAGLEINVNGRGRGRPLHTCPLGCLG